ncbi:uncharacterized protein LOC122723221 [Manihot esculenta]|uniref:uncharacterized protein LOC122723221 n=1 Tax=Manihot esculenta TaxID=3983 RepID=UPI001CC79788|nr:uncharacterized protein LOC122723221 [Manihot esculenta]
MASSSKPIPFIEENYGLAFHQSMQQLVDEIHKETLNLSHFINVFYRLMQSKVDPPIETIWIYSALSFRSRKKANQDLSDHILIVKELFQLISRCSGPCSASKSIALLAPVVFQVYNLVVELLGKDLGARRVKKAAKEAKSLIGEIIGYVSVCCGKDVSKESDSNLSVSFLDLASLWIDGNDGFKGFLPLTSDEIYKEISVGGSTVANLAGVVISEVFLLKLCLDLRIGNRGEALEKELRSWIVGSITGLQSFYFFGEWIHSSEDESFLRRILYDAAILVEYSFLSPEKAVNITANHVRDLAVKRLIITHEALELFRKSGDQKRAIAYSSSFSNSGFRTQIIQYITSQVGIGEEASRLKGASPKALIKFLLNLDGQGIRLFDDTISKFHAKLAFDDSKSDYEQLAFKPGGKKADADLFYIDNKGEEENLGEDDKEVNESMSNAFIASAQRMRLMENGGKKRKEERNARKKKKIKLLKHTLSDTSDSDEERSTSASDDDSGSESEVENPTSDEDV